MLINKRRSSVASLCRTVLAVGVAAMIAAGCGGGDNASVVLDKPGVALYTTAGPATSLSVGSSTTFTIGGGGGGSSFATYTATSSDSSIVTVTVSGKTLILSGVKSGAATIAVKDSDGGSLTINISVGVASTLAITAPSTVSIAVNASNNFSIFGGNAPFSVISGNLGVATAVLNSDGNSLTVTGVASGGAQISVFDAKGGTASFTASIGSGKSTSIPLFSTSPSALTLSVAGNSPTYQIGGGTGPYSATSSAPDVLIASASNQTVMLVPNSIGSSVVSIKDSTGAVVTIAVNVTSGKIVQPFYTTSPSSIAVKVGVSSTYSVAGGTSPYTSTSSDPSIATTNINGAVLAVSGVSVGVAKVVVLDATGASINIDVASK